MGKKMYRFEGDVTVHVEFETCLTPAEQQEWEHGGGDRVEELMRSGAIAALEEDAAWRGSFDGDPTDED